MGLIMKKVYLVALISSLILGCGGGGADKPSVNVGNGNGTTDPIIEIDDEDNGDGDSEIETGSGQADGDSYFVDEPPTLQSGEFDQVWTRSPSAYTLASYYKNPWDLEVSFANNEFRSNAVGGNVPKFISADKLYIYNNTNQPISTSPLKTRVGTIISRRLETTASPKGKIQRFVVQYTPYGTAERNSNDLTITDTFIVKPLYNKAISSILFPAIYDIYNLNDEDVKKEIQKQELINVEEYTASFVKWKVKDRATIPFRDGAYCLFLESSSANKPYFTSSEQFNSVLENVLDENDDSLREQNTRLAYIYKSSFYKDGILHSESDISKMGIGYYSYMVPSIYMFGLSYSNQENRYLGGYYHPKEVISIPNMMYRKYSAVAEDDVLLNGHVWTDTLANEVIYPAYRRNVNNGCTFFNATAIDDITNWETIN